MFLSSFSLLVRRTHPQHCKFLYPPLTFVRNSSSSSSDATPDGYVPPDDSEIVASYRKRILDAGLPFAGAIGLANYIFPPENVDPNVFIINPGFLVAASVGLLSIKPDLLLKAVGKGGGKRKHINLEAVERETTKRSLKWFLLGGVIGGLGVFMRMRVEEREWAVWREKMIEIERQKIEEIKRRKAAGEDVTDLLAAKDEEKSLEQRKLDVDIAAVAKIAARIQQ